MNKDFLARFGVSMPEDLIRQFDHYINEQGYTNRSEAIRDLVRKALLEPGKLNSEQFVAGTIVMVYDHHIQDIPFTLMDLQHEYHREIISTMHIHLNHHQCLEILVVRGILNKVRELQQSIQIQKGVYYADLSVTFVDQYEKPHEH